MLELQQLHQDVDTYVPPGWRAMFHLLVDLERVTRIECQMTECVGETRELSPYVQGRGRSGGSTNEGTYDPWQCTINHIKPTAQGGQTRAENLELAHARCNYRQGGQISDTYGRKIGRWSPEAQERRRVNAAAAAKRLDVRAKKSESMKKVHADPEHKKKVKAAITKSWAPGGARRAARSTDKTECTECGVEYEPIHMTRHKNDGRCEKNRAPKC